MKKSAKILIGSGLLVGAAVATYMVWKRSQENAQGSAQGSTAAPGGGSNSTALPATVPQAQRVSKYPEGTLIRAHGEYEVYLIDAQGYRHYIKGTSYPVQTQIALAKKGFNWNNVIAVSTAEVLAVPRKEDLSGINILL